LDTVTLSNGTEVRGTILESTNQRVKIKAEDGTLMVFDMTEVQKIDRTTPTAPAPAPELAPAPAPAVMETSQPARGSALRKDPRLAFRMSCYFPGGGQFYNGESGKGALQLGLVITGIIVAIAEAPRYDDYYDYWGEYLGTEKTGGNDAACAAGIVVAVGSWIWSVVDAPIGAENYNRAHRLGLYEDPLKNRSLAVEPVVFGGTNKDKSGLQVAYRF